MKGLLKFITCGSVDDGKSTLIGHILYDSKLLYADQERALELDSKAGSRGGKIDYSLLLDGLMEEREQGITIDVAYRYFTTNERSFIVADTPGHEEYTRNMAVGASFADLAVILVDASQGVLIQTRRHARICALMGIRYFVFAVNKMDLIDYDEGRFRAIESQIHALVRELGLTAKEGSSRSSPGSAAASDEFSAENNTPGRSVSAARTEPVGESSPTDTVAASQYSAPGTASASRNSTPDSSLTSPTPDPNDAWIGDNSMVNTDPNAGESAPGTTPAGSAPARATANSRIVIIPVSATEGDNVTKRSGYMPWYTGPVLLSHLETIDIEEAETGAGFYMPVQRVCRPDHTFRGFQGQIESGTVHIGDEVESLPSGERAHVKSILVGDRSVQSAFSGQPVTMQLDREVDVSRGCVLAAAAGAKITSSLSATVLWMDEEPLVSGKNFFVKVGTSLIPGEVTEIESVIDVNSGKMRNFASGSAGAAGKFSATEASTTADTSNKSSASKFPGTTENISNLSASNTSGAVETAYGSSAYVVSIFNADSTGNIANTAGPSVISKPPKGFRLHKNEIAHCRITLSDRIVADSFQNHRTLGELILIDRVSFHTAACGIIETVSDNSREGRIGDKTVNEYLRLSLKSQNPVTALFVKGRDPISTEQVAAVEKHLVHQGRHTYLYRPPHGEDFLTVIRHLTRAGIITLLILSEEQAAGIDPQELGWLAGWGESGAASGNATHSSRFSGCLDPGAASDRIPDGLSGAISDEISGGIPGASSDEISNGIPGASSDEISSGIFAGTSAVPANRNKPTSPLCPEEIAAVIRKKSSYVSFEAFDRDYI